MPEQIHQILPTLGYGDAIGNQVLELRRLLRGWGYTSEIFAERWHPRLAGECHYYAEYAKFSRQDNLLILHYSIGGEVNQFVQTLPDHLVLYYHNITPSNFFYRVNGEIARWLEEARRGLGQFAGQVPAIAASPFNQQELEQLGFRVVGIVPYVLLFEQLDTGLTSKGSAHIRKRFGKQDTIDWLFVGRLAPNKCVHDIIKSFYYYHSWITPHSRLLLVGSGEGVEPYVNELYRLVTHLNLDGSVIFAGHHAAMDGLAAFYKMADVYISMSEHEGFCIPLLEAMYYNVPVLAFASTGVPFTLGESGVLIQRKEYPIIAEVVNEIITNKVLQMQLLDTQKNRLKAFSPDVVPTQLRACIEAVGKLDSNNGKQIHG